MLRIGTFCSGIGSAEIAAQRLGWNPVFSSEIDDRASVVLAHHFPETVNLGDMLEVDGYDWRSEVDIVVAGSPCFTGATLVLTAKGMIPISEVCVGDAVFTHKNRWRRVVRKGSKVAETCILRGRGASFGVETTPEHRFLSVTKKYSWDKNSRSTVRTLSSEEWVSASEMQKRFWAVPSAFPPLPIPEVTTHGCERFFSDVTPDFMRIVGRWVGDGWTRITDRRGYAMIADGIADSDGLRADLNRAGIRYSEYLQGPTIRFQVTSRPFARWLKEQFGAGARGKTLPPWLLGASKELRQAFLDGYIAADGKKRSNGSTIATVSKKLAVSTVMLAASLGLSVSCGFYKPKKYNPSTIDGRVIKNNGCYEVAIYNRARSAVVTETRHWGLVRAYESGGAETVFDLEVEEDHSYVADGIIVHNCQGFSSAGQRQGLQDPRSALALNLIEHLAAIRPRWFVWENVINCRSTNDGRDLAKFLGCLSGRAIATPDRWGNAGIVDGYRNAYGLAWRVLDAQYFGVAQRRRRVFVVGCLGGWQRATQALFEPDVLPGDSTAISQSKGEAAPLFAATVGGGRQREPILSFTSNDHGGDCGVVCPTLRSGTGVRRSGGVKPAIVTEDTLRTMTVRECERLQGLPDDWTLVPYNGRPMADCWRLGMVGNAIAVPVVQWIFERINEVEGSCEFKSFR